LLCQRAEECFDKYLFVIVPAINDERDSAQIREWHEMEAKPYRIRVVDPDDKLMKSAVVPGGERKWTDLDGEELEFKSTARPRARYLYYHYCVAMLRRSWHRGEHATILKDELGRKLWATPGPYLRKKLLLAFAEEIGNQQLLEGAMSDNAATQGQDNEERDDVLGSLAILSASKAVAHKDRSQDEAECEPGRHDTSDEDNNDDEDENENSDNDTNNTDDGDDKDE
jgi:hypothetical protein